MEGQRAVLKVESGGRKAFCGAGRHSQSRNRTWARESSEGFYKIIRQWVEDKGIQVKKPDSFAYLVARKIAKEGTELYRNRKHEEIYSRDLENTVDNIASRVSAIYETEVEHINLNFDNENTYDR